MNNTKIDFDELLGMFKKADEIAKNDLFVDDKWNVYKKSTHPNDWDYDKNFSSLSLFAECYISVNMTQDERDKNYIDLNNPYHFAINEVVSQIHERVDVGNTFDKFWELYDNACKVREEKDGLALEALNENACLYELQDNFDSLSTENLNKIYDYFCETMPLFKELSEQMNLSKEYERAELFNELYYIYNHGANNGSSGLIYCADMERFYDNNKDEMLDFLALEAFLCDCENKMEYLAKFVNCDLENYKWKAVQHLAYNYSMVAMERTLSELNLKNDNSQELVDEKTQTGTNKPKNQKR